MYVFNNNRNFKSGDQFITLRVVCVCMVMVSITFTKVFTVYLKCVVHTYSFWPIELTIMTKLTANMAIQ